MCQWRLFRKGCVICMYKIGVIGDYDSICGFSALGMDTFPVSHTGAAEKTLRNLAENGYGIIYITEEYIEKMPALFEKYQESQVPAVVPIPSCKGATGFGIGNVKRYVEQAVGSDIIFNGE